MVAWIPIAKALAPHVTAIVTAALPAFTRRDDPVEASSPGLTQQQIAELQAAATRNDAHIRELAEQLQTAAQAIEQAAALADRRLRQLWLVSGVSLTTAVAALLVALLK